MINTYTFLWAQVSMACMLLFIWFFVPTKQRLANRIFITVVIYIGCTSVDYLQYFVVQKDITQIIQSMVEAVVVQGSVFYLCKYKDFRALFSGLTAAVVVLVGNTLAVIVFLVTGSIVFSLISQILVHGIVLGILLNFSRENWLYLFEGEKTRWRELCTIPLLFWLVIYALTVWPQNVWQGNNGSNMLAVVILLVLLEMSYFIILAGMAAQYHTMEVQHDNERLENYAERLKREADRLHEQEMETAVIRHDLRHYVTQIQGYLSVGDTEEVHEVLKQLNQKIVEVTPKRYCSNLAVNSVIAYCKSLAEKDDVKLVIETEVPQKLSMNEFEFATVVSNLLENAVHAATKVSDPEKRKATIKIHEVKKQLMVEISNSYAELPKISQETGLPISNNGKDHGYGVKSVQAFAKKNDAIVDYEVDKDRITVRMLV